MLYHGKSACGNSVAPSLARVTTGDFRHHGAADVSREDAPRHRRQRPAARPWLLMQLLPDSARLFYHRRWRALRWRLPKVAATKQMTWWFGPVWPSHSGSASAAADGLAVYYRASHAVVGSAGPWFRLLRDGWPWLHPLWFNRCNVDAVKWILRVSLMLFLGACSARFCVKVPNREQVILLGDIYL